MSVAILLTNYRRPWNLPRQIDAGLRSARKPDIFLIDNAEDQALEGSPAIPFDRITFLRSPANFGPGHRVEVAASLACDVVVMLDDDIFLTPSQIDALVGKFEADPRRMHGVWGQECRIDDGRLRIRPGVFRVTREIEVLNRVYVLSPAQARAATQLARRLGYAAWRDVKVGMDVILSYGSPKKPMCHDLGPLEDCPSSNDPRIAVWRRPGFVETRRKLILALEELQAREGRPKPV
jgi:hypothetical protein